MIQFLTEIAGQIQISTSKKQTNKKTACSWDIIIADLIFCKIISIILLESCFKLQATYMPRTHSAVRKLWVQTFLFLQVNDRLTWDICKLFKLQLYKTDWQHYYAEPCSCTEDGHSWNISYLYFDIAHPQNQMFANYFILRHSFCIHNMLLEDFWLDLHFFLFIEVLLHLCLYAIYLYLSCFIFWLQDSDAVLIYDQMFDTKLSCLTCREMQNWGEKKGMQNYLSLCIQVLPSHIFNSVLL